jgi:hypothetical protein
MGHCMVAGASDRCLPPMFRNHAGNQKLLTCFVSVTLALHLCLQLRQGLAKMGHFEVVSPSDRCLPLVTFHLKDKEGRSYDEFNIADRLKTFGWVVPA